MKKKIAIIASTSKLGGTEISSLRICKMLKEKSEDVVYIAPGNMLQDEMHDIKFISYKFSKKNPLSIIKAIISIFNIVKREKIDILHCQDATSCVFCCYAKKYLNMKARIIWHERGIHYKSYTTMSKRYISTIDTIVCNSYYERTLLIMNRCPPEKTTVIYNAIEKQIPTRARYDIRKELGINQNDFVIGTVGRQTWDKGFSTLLTAAAYSKKHIQNLKILLVGDGVERKNLEQLAQKLGIADSVMFTGLRRDIPNMLFAMDIFAIPSWFEAFGNVTVEAMYAKIPVLASRVGGIQEVIQDGINGLLIPAAEPDVWAEKIIYAYDHYDEMKKLSRTAYDDACARYNFDVYYEKIMDVYTKS